MRPLMKKFLLIACMLLSELSSSGQVRWHDPMKAAVSPVEGLGWPGEVRTDPLQRLPDRMRPLVRPVIWMLSQNNAGLSIRFRTDSPQIVVRYGLSDPYAQPHMPATGFSGVDLYARTTQGEQVCPAGSHEFADTVTYRYGTIGYGERAEAGGREFRLYLPVCNHVTWMEIGTAQDASFEFLPARTEKPVVVYGTSITQGIACSRPGMSWTSQTARALDCPLVNLGFAGNGLLEPELIGEIAKIDARVYVLDCLPNLVFLPKEEVKALVAAAVRQLREKRPGTPILLSDHPGFPHKGLVDSLLRHETKVREAVEEACAELVRDKIPRLYFLSQQQIGLPADGTVEGLHPTDYGMAAYAAAYEKALRRIFRQNR